MLRFVFDSEKRKTITVGQQTPIRRHIMENTVSTATSNLAIIEAFLQSGKAIEFSGEKATLVTWKDQHILRATEVEPVTVQDGESIFIPSIRIADGVKIPQKSGLSFLLGLFGPKDFFLEARVPTDPQRCCRVRCNSIAALIVSA